MLEINIWFLCFLMAFIYIVIKEYNKPVIDVQKAFKYLKKDIVRLIVFYQSYYPASDQIVLVKKWFDSIKIDEIPKEQLKLFKDYVNKL